MVTRLNKCKTTAVTSAMLLHLTCPAVASAHGGPIVYIVYAVLGVFVAYQIALAVVLRETKGLEKHRLLSLLGYGLTLVPVWIFVILDLEFESPVLYFLLSFGIPAVTAITIYLFLRRDAAKVEARSEG